MASAEAQGMWQGRGVGDWVGGDTWPGFMGTSGLCRGWEEVDDCFGLCVDGEGRGDWSREMFLEIWVIRGPIGTHLDFPGQGAACSRGF